MTAGLSPARLKRSGRLLSPGSGASGCALERETLPGDHGFIHTRGAMPAPVSLTLALRRIVQGKNPRQCYDPDEMADLEARLRAVGPVIQPIFMRSIPGADLTRMWPASAAKNVFDDDCLTTSMIF